MQFLNVVTCMSSVLSEYLCVYNITYLICVLYGNFAWVNPPIVVNLSSVGGVPWVPTISGDTES